MTFSLSTHEAELCSRLAKMGSPHKLPRSNGSLEEDEVRTLFVSGLPMDVRPRELYLLFRTYEGYEGCFLKLISSKPGKPPQPIAFVSFRTRAQAEKALEELRGVHFDPASTQTLRLEFARTNSRVSPRQPQPCPSPGPMPMNQSYFHAQQIQKGDSYGLYMLPDGSMAQHNNSPGGGAPTTDCWTSRVPMSVPYTPSMATPTHAPTYTHSSQSHPSHYPMFNSFPELGSPYSMPAHVYYYNMLPTPSPPPSLGSVLGSHSGPPTPVNNLPCSTLFVANLESHQTEEEVTNLFSSCPGFMKAKMLSKGGPPVSFVEFKDIDCAKSAMEKLQGFVMTSRRGSGVRIEYAKQKMGEPSRSPSNDGSGTSSPIQSITNGHGVSSQSLPPTSSAVTATFMAGTSKEFNPSCALLPGIGAQSPRPKLFVSELSTPPVFPSWPLKTPSDLICHQSDSTVADAPLAEF